jgi:hypothetical protein
MKRRILKTIRLVILSILCVFICCPASVLGLSPAVYLTIENQSDQILKIYIDGDYVGLVKPGEEIEGPVPPYHLRYIIAAQNIEGEVVFVKSYEEAEYYRYSGGCAVGKKPAEETSVEETSWNLTVIPSDIPRRGVTYADLVIENKTNMVLTISDEEEFVSVVGPSDSVTQSDLPHLCILEKSINYRITAHDDQGQKICSAPLDLDELQLIDLETFKTAIEKYYKEIIIHNEKDYSVTVFVDAHRVGDIKPGETLRDSVPLYTHFANIVAYDFQGKSVYSLTYRNYNNYAYSLLQDEAWEIVITAFGD